MPMESTVPIWPAFSIKSPTEKGRKMMIMIPLAMLERPPWSARPTATPAEATRATIEDMGTPRYAATVIRMIALRAMLAKLVMNFR